MLNEWIARQNAEDDRPDAAEALTNLWEIVSNAPDEAIPELLGALTEDRFGSLVEIPLYDHDSTELLVRIMNRLAPDPDQSEVLAERFQLSWSISVMGGEGFEPRPLLNGVILVRNAHRILGPSMWDGVTRELDPDLVETLAADLKMLRARNADGEPVCFLLSNDMRGARLLGAVEPLDLGAPGWGQLIAVCALQPEDLEEGALLQTRALRKIGRKARSLVVFLRFFGDRVDLIPASRYDDDLDIFLEELAVYELGSNIEEGMDLPVPLAGDRLIEGVVERIAYETGHIPEEGCGAAWFREYAVQTLAVRLARTMNWSTVNFGLGPDPDGPRRAVPLPAGVESAIAADLGLKRRSVTLEVMTAKEAARDMIVDGLVLERIAEAFAEVGVEDVGLRVTGRVDHDLDPDVAAFMAIEELKDTFNEVLGRIAERSEEEGEELDDAVVNASLAIILLVDFPDERPSDLTIAAMARALSGALEETVRLFLNGRGEYLAYADGDVDSGDHELFRLDEGTDGGADEEDTPMGDQEGNSLTIDVYTKDVDAACAAFKAAVVAGATNVRISSNEAWGTRTFENINLTFDAAPVSSVASLVKRPPFVRDPSELDDDGSDEPGDEGEFVEEDEPDAWDENDPEAEDGDEPEKGADSDLSPAPVRIISLIKGQNLSLSKKDLGLERIVIGLGWDPRATNGQEFDLDASLFMLGENGKVRSDADLIFYNQKMSGCGSVEYTGDNLTGAGDNRQIRVDFSLIPAEVHRLAVTVTIHNADARRQSFGQVGNAFIRVVNEDTGAEVVRYDLSEDYSTETAMIFGEVYRHNQEWKFRAVGQGYAGGLIAMCGRFGIVL